MKVRVIDSSVGSSWFPSPASIPASTGTDSEAWWEQRPGTIPPTPAATPGWAPLPAQLLWSSIPRDSRPQISSPCSRDTLVGMGDSGQAPNPWFPPRPNVGAASADLWGSHEHFTSSLLIMQPEKKGQPFFPRPLQAQDNPRRDLAAPNRGFSGGQCFTAPLLERGCSLSIKEQTETLGWALHKSVPFNPPLPTVCKLGETGRADWTGQGKGLTLCALGDVLGSRRVEEEASLGCAQQLNPRGRSRSSSGSLLIPALDKRNKSGCITITSSHSSHKCRTLRVILVFRCLQQHLCQAWVLLDWTDPVLLCHQLLGHEGIFMLPVPLEVGNRYQGDFSGD